MRYVKKAPKNLEFCYKNVYGANVYFSPKSKRYYEFYEDCIKSYSFKEF